MDNRPQFVSTFIELYRSFPCLWKVKDEQYHNRRLKEGAYAQLLEFYKTAIPTATIDTVKKKINNLKCTFRKELKKVKKQKSGSDDNYVSNLWYFDLLMFTIDHEMPRKSISSENIVVDVDVDQNEIFCEENISRPSHSSLSSHSPQSSHSPLPSYFPRPSNSSTQTRETPLPSKRKHTLINQAYKALKEGDEYDGIGLNVSCKLRRMNEDQRLLAECLINKVILYGIKNRLTENTNVTGLVPTRASDPGIFCMDDSGTSGLPTQTTLGVEAVVPTHSQIAIHSKEEFN